MKKLLLFALVGIVVYFLYIRNRVSTQSVSTSGLGQGSATLPTSSNSTFPSTATSFVGGGSIPTSNTPISTISSVNITPPSMIAFAPNDVVTTQPIDLRVLPPQPIQDATLGTTLTKYSDPDTAIPLRGFRMDRIGRYML